MTDHIFTEKQMSEIRAFKNNQFKRINLYDGSVRSGKTWISIVIWCLWVASRKQNFNYLMVGKSIGTLKRNVLDLAVNIFSDSHISYSISSKQAIIFGKKVYLEGANDSESESKIRGMTIHGAYCDELSLFPEQFFSMLLTRLSTKDAKLFATTNPDNPNHWLMKNYISNKDKLDFRYVKFSIFDNTTLDPKYIQDMQNEFSGIFYDRFILGNWVTSVGAIYPEFSSNLSKFVVKDSIPFDLAYSQIGVDFGGNGSAHAFNLTGFSSDFRYIITLDEWYFKGDITPKQLEDKFIWFVRKNLQFRPIVAFCDSAEQVLISGIRASVIKEGLGISIKNARKYPIVQRIRFYNSVFSKRAFFIMEHCEHTISAFQNAVWDSRSLTDVRLDNGSSNIDTLDAQEYSTENHMSTIIQMIGSKNINEYKVSLDHKSVLE